jgi:ABC-type Fe3+/spermidine/putrescine transport system ATPase subunit
MRDDPPVRSAGLTVESLSLTLGDFALRNVSFAVGPGEIGVVLGPNGAGKSVTLETIAGFHRPDSGRVRIGERDVTALPPERRHVAFILQNFGLFPHLTVAQNVAFGLRQRSGRRSPADVQSALMRFRLTGLAQHRPATLSPGEKQRVALARSLITDPDVFLLDEPFAAIDSQTSSTLREEFRQFIREARIPAIFVTHDHSDALTLADTVAVMAAGEIVQAGPPDDVFSRPETPFVAEFLGVENILSGIVVGRQPDGCAVEVGGQRLTALCLDPPRVGALVALCLRADAVDIRRADDRSDAGADRATRLAGTITTIAGGAPLIRVVLDCGFPLTAHMLGRTARKLRLEPRMAVVADIEPCAIHVIREP